MWTFLCICALVCVGESHCMSISASFVLMFGSCCSWPKVIVLSCSPTQDYQHNTAHIYVFLFQGMLAALASPKPGVPTQAITRTPWGQRVPRTHTQHKWTRETIFWRVKHRCVPGKLPSEKKNNKNEVASVKTLTSSANWQPHKYHHRSFQSIT